MITVEHPRQVLNFIANFGVAGEISRLDPAFADLTGRLHFGPIIFRLAAVEHQPGRFPGDLTPQFGAIHPEGCRAARGAKSVNPAI